MSFYVNRNALTAIWSSATQGGQSLAVVHYSTETYNFNVISRDSGPSFGVSKALHLGKSPDKAHWEEGTDCGSVSMRQKPFCEQHQVEEKFLYYFQSKRLRRFVFTPSVPLSVIIYCF